MTYESRNYKLLIYDWFTGFSAQKAGVIMDVGHGQGSFDWSVTDIALKSKVFPDTISSDLHSGNIHGPAKDLANVMSKMLTLGMPLNKVSHPGPGTK